MQTVGGYSDFRTQSEFEPVGETGARIPVDRGGVDLVEELFGPGMTPISDQPKSSIRKRMTLGFDFSFLAKERTVKEKENRKIHLISILYLPAVFAKLSPLATAIHLQLSLVVRNLS